MRVMAGGAFHLIASAAAVIEAHFVGVGAVIAVGVEEGHTARQLDIGLVKVNGRCVGVGIEYADRVIVAQIGADHEGPEAVEFGYGAVMAACTGAGYLAISRVRPKCGVCAGGRAFVRVRNSPLIEEGHVGRCAAAGILAIVDGVPARARHVQYRVNGDGAIMAGQAGQRGRAWYAHGAHQRCWLVVGFVDAIRSNGSVPEWGINLRVGAVRRMAVDTDRAIVVAVIVHSEPNITFAAKPQVIHGHVMSGVADATSVGTVVAR